MSDVQNTTTEATTEADEKRKRVSKRDFLAAGDTVKTIEEATGARYTLLAPEGNINFDSGDLGEAGKLATMCAIFGFHTKVGNVANTVLNDKDEPGSPADAGAAIKEFIAQANGGVWAERTTGAPGTRVDKDALAGAIVAVMLASGKLVAADEGAMYAKVRDKLETDPQYVRNSRQVPQVASEYNTRVGKAAKTVDSLMI